MNKKNMVFALVIAFVALLSLGPVNQAQSADLAPGEGGYLGAFLGYGMGVIQADVTSAAQGANAPNTSRERASNTYETDRGGLGLEGIQGGGWVGYGIKTADDIYFGF